MARDDADRDGWLAVYKRVQSAVTQYATADTETQGILTTELLKIADSDDPGVAFAAVQGLRRVFLEEIASSSPQKRRQVASHHVRSVLGSTPSPYRAQLLRQLLKKQTVEDHQGGDSEEEEDDDDKDIHVLYSCSVIQEVDSFGQFLLHLVDAADASAVTEGMLLTSDLLKRPQDIEDCRDQVHQLAMSVGDHVISWNFDVRPTYLACGVIDFMIDWRAFLVKNADCDTEEVDEDSTERVEWLVTAQRLVNSSSSITTQAMLLCREQIDSNHACSDAFISSSSSYPFLQKWLLLLSMAMKDSLDNASDPSFGVLCELPLPMRSQIMAILTEQDDVLVDVLDHLLGITLHFDDRGIGLPDSLLHKSELHADTLFSDLVKNLGDDHLVLVDMLMSSETRMLEYLVRYLRRCVLTWPEAREAWTQENRLEVVMSVLIRLRMEVEKLFASGVFPYNPSPLLRRLISLEEAYEHDEEPSDEGVIENC
ncbi:hypothetical protein Poli38472_005591 [Pythium oligandrum]|uniref:Uncharacterized protein n=1 Tax=Pythium oligandrum TaxID=41045 RepID=A0A8K1CH99_PYTOL|nr:hypothetical protein Poli38472_005591 [Pythium oligandrum]|eukprot:TMW62973.1 hypothetical protein Poli38472_005591 [Pythium oligandrum]